MSSNDGIMETVPESEIGASLAPGYEETASPITEMLRLSSHPQQEGGSLSKTSGTAYRLSPARSERVLTFDLHPLYASILSDGATAKRGEVLGLDGDLRRALVAPFDGVIRLLVTGTGPERRVKVFLTEQLERREHFARRL